MRSLHKLIVCLILAVYFLVVCSGEIAVASPISEQLSNLSSIDSISHVANPTLTQVRLISLPKRLSEKKGNHPKKQSNKLHTSASPEKKASPFLPKESKNKLSILTNIDAEISAKAILEEFNVNSGFSGAYHMPTRQWVALPSGNASLRNGLSVEPLVALSGGHAEAEKTLIDKIAISPTENAGFVLILKSDQVLEIRWNSGIINGRNFKSKACPEEFRNIIKESIELDTGYKVVEQVVDNLNG